MPNKALHRTSKSWRLFRAAELGVMRIMMKTIRSAFLRGCLLLLPVDASAGCFHSFEELLAAIDDDRQLQENSEGFYIEELVLKEDGSLAEKRRLRSVPDKYAYHGRIFPSQAQQQLLGMSVYIRRVVLKDVRVATEKHKDGSEPSSYWFWRVDGCWYLNSRAVSVER